jgi:hypothetical protein
MDEGAAVAYGTATIDTTASVVFYMSTQPSVADTGNTITCPQATLRVKL